MARQLRVEYAGAIYYVMNRGDRRELIFMDDADRQRFVDTLGEACAKTGWQVHAYVLMPNHFHVVIETPLPNLVAGMKWLLGTYTSRFNRRREKDLAPRRLRHVLVPSFGQFRLRPDLMLPDTDPDRGVQMPGTPRSESYCPTTGNST